MRGHYGYGRPAHGADPSASYHFRGADEQGHASKEYLEEIAKDFDQEFVSQSPNPAGTKVTPPSDDGTE